MTSYGRTVSSSLRLLALTAGVFARPAPADEAGAPGAQPRAQRADPSLRITREARGLAQPWDVQPIGRGILVTERTDAARLLLKDGHVRRMRFPKSSVRVSGETGLMSMEIDPRFGSVRPVLHLSSPARAAAAGEGRR